MATAVYALSLCLTCRAWASVAAAVMVVVAMVVAIVVATVVATVVAMVVAMVVTKPGLGKGVTTATMT